MPTESIVRLAVDIASGDRDRTPPFRLRASYQALAEDPNMHMIMHGAEGAPIPYDMEDRLVIKGGSPIYMDDAVTPELLRRGDSAMGGALMDLRDGTVDGCISAGNTAALLAMSRRLLGCEKGLRRPAMAAALPHRKGITWLMDSGANLHCNAEQLVQFARMGGRLTSDPKPRIGLLNIGKEAIKGTAEIRLADQILSQDYRLNYCGFAESDDLLIGRFDIVICDGLLGNVSLKAVEGTARYLIAAMEHQISSRPVIGALLAMLWRPLRHQLEPARFNGAILLGAKGLVVKSHGNADDDAFLQAIRYTARTARSV